MTQNHFKTNLRNIKLVNFEREKCQSDFHLCSKIGIYSIIYVTRLNSSTYIRFRQVHERKCKKITYICTWKKVFRSQLPLLFLKRLTIKLQIFTLSWNLKLNSEGRFLNLIHLLGG